MVSFDMKITPEENLRVSARNEANGALRAESVRKFTGRQIQRGARNLQSPGTAVERVA
jgi:hypothetical protein